MIILLRNSSCVYDVFVYLFGFSCVWWLGAVPVGEGLRWEDGDVWCLG